MSHFNLNAIRTIDARTFSSLWTKAIWLFIERTMKLNEIYVYLLAKAAVSLQKGHSVWLFIKHLKIALFIFLYSFQFRSQLTSTKMSISILCIVNLFEWHQIGFFILLIRFACLIVCFHFSCAQVSILKYKSIDCWNVNGSKSSVWQAV